MSICAAAIVLLAGAIAHAQPAPRQEYGAAGAQAAPAPTAAPQRSAPVRPDFVDSDFRPHSGYGHKPYKKHKSWLSEIFD